MTAPPDAIRRPAGCDLFSFSLATLDEERLDGPSTAASEYLPSIDRGRIAFVRDRGGRARIFVSSRIGSSRTREVPGGIGGSAAKPGPIDVDLGRRHVAVAWLARRGGAWAAEVATSPTAGAGTRTRLAAKRSDATSVTVLTSPTVTPAATYFLTVKMGLGRYADLIRVSHRGARSLVPLPYVAIGAVQDGRETWSLRAAAIDDARPACVAPPGAERPADIDETEELRCYVGSEGRLEFA